MIKQARQLLEDIDIRQPVDISHPLNRGRVAWWLVVPQRFGGQVWYDLVSGYPATLTTVVNGFGWKPSNYTNNGGSLQLDGTSGFLQTTFYPPAGSNARSIGFWFNTRSAGAVGSNPVLFYGISGITGAQWDTTVEAGTVWMRGSSTTGSWGVSFNDGKWHHCVQTFPRNGTMQSVQCYVDGKQLSGIFTAGTTALNTSVTTLQIGFSVAPNFFSGNVNDITVYNRQLSAGEVDQIYNLGPLGYPDLLRKRRRNAWFLTQAAPVQPTPERVPLTMYSSTVAATPSFIALPP